MQYVYISIFYLTKNTKFCFTIVYMIYLDQLYNNAKEEFEKKHTFYVINTSSKNKQKIFSELSDFYERHLSKSITFNIDHIITSYIIPFNPLVCVHIVVKKNDIQTNDTNLTHTILNVLYVLIKILFPFTYTNFLKYDGEKYNINDDIFTSYCNNIILYFNNHDRDIRILIPDKITGNFQKQLNLSGNGLTTGGSTYITNTTPKQLNTNMSELTIRGSNIIMCDQYTCITIKRSGLIKTLIHELMHAMKLDSYFIYQTDSAYDTFFKTLNIVNIKSANYFEAIAELLSVIFNTICYSCYNSKPFYEILKEECDFSTKLVIKYFRLHKYNNIEDIKGFFSGKMSGTPIFNVTTFMYIVVRDILFQNIEKFVDIYLPKFIIQPSQFFDFFNSRNMSRYLEHLEKKINDPLTDIVSFNYIQNNLGENEQNKIQIISTENGYDIPLINLNKLNESTHMQNGGQPFITKPLVTVQEQIQEVNNKGEVVDVTKYSEIYHSYPTTMIRESIQRGGYYYKYEKYKHKYIKLKKELVKNKKIL